MGSWKEFLLYSNLRKFLSPGTGHLWTKRLVACTHTQKCVRVCALHVIIKMKLYSICGMSCTRFLTSCPLPSLLVTDLTYSKIFLIDLFEMWNLKSTLVSTYCDTSSFNLSLEMFYSSTIAVSTLFWYLIAPSPPLPFFWHIAVPWVCPTLSLMLHCSRHCLLFYSLAGWSV